MLKDKEVDQQKDDSLETCPDLQQIGELLDYIVFDFHNFNEPRELCHPDQLVHFPQARKSSDFVDVPRII